MSTKSSVLTGQNIKNDSECDWHVSESEKLMYKHYNDLMAKVNNFLSEKNTKPINVAEKSKSVDSSKKKGRQRQLKNKKQKNEKQKFEKVSTNCFFLFLLDKFKRILGLIK